MNNRIWVQIKVAQIDMLAMVESYSFFVLEISTIREKDTNMCCEVLDLWSDLSYMLLFYTSK